MGLRYKLARAFLKAPASIEDEVFEQLLESARYETFSRAGSSARLMAISVLINGIAVALVIVCSSLLLLSDHLESVNVVSRAIAVGFCLAVFSGTAYVLNSYFRAKLLKPRFDELLLKNPGLNERTCERGNE